LKKALALATNRPPKRSAKREAELLAQSVYGRRSTATFAEAALNYMEQGAVAVASLSQ
jgi:hypothetical protein